MRYTPKIGEPVALEAISIEVEESDGRTKGELVRYDEKGEMLDRAEYYFVTVTVTLTN